MEIVMAQPYESLSDEELLPLIKKWKDNPSEYTKILVSRIYPTIYSLTKPQVEKFNVKNDISFSATSVVNEIFLKMHNGSRKHDLDTLRGFYELLGQIVISSLLDRKRKLTCQKRMPDFYKPNESVATLETVCDIELIYDGLNKLSHSEPFIAEKMSLKLYSAKNNEQIAAITNSSISTVEKHLRHGKRLMNAIIEGVEIGY
ncbi:hypothetical protein GCM10017161_42200 [Thalassotalea marina]|uniref:RNA polymerase sigma-70 ECF-like HTH domain-containing protein n=2 Tax=Thalassotalea marina TaxID=1673741 RepID=A0A919BSQ4_9GAMM|nr:hypothetical protein GCM10017161_42200 [Thalassotalea marina]